MLTLDGQPVLKSTHLQVLDPTTKATVKLNLAIVQAARHSIKRHQVKVVGMMVLGDQKIDRWDSVRIDRVRRAGN